MPPKKYYIVPRLMFGLLLAAAVCGSARADVEYEVTFNPSGDDKLDSAWAAYLTAQSQTERYRSKYLAEAVHVRDNLEFSYRNGNTTLLDYLSALSDYRQVNLAALNARLQLLLSLEQLSYAAHTEIVPRRNFIH